MHWILVVAGQFISKDSNWANPQAEGVHGLPKAVWAFALSCDYASPDVKADGALLSAAEWQLDGSERKPVYDAQAGFNSTLLRSYTGYNNPLKQ